MSRVYYDYGAKTSEAVWLPSLMPDLHNVGNLQHEVF